VGSLAWVHFHDANVLLFYFLLIISEEELHLLVIIVDTNPIWWGKQALKESQVRLCVEALTWFWVNFLCVFVGFFFFLNSFINV
jgi:hypothetical protein